MGRLSSYGGALLVPDRIALLIKAPLFSSLETLAMCRRGFLPFKG